MLSEATRSVADLNLHKLRPGLMISGRAIINKRKRYFSQRRPQVIPFATVIVHTVTIRLGGPRPPGESDRARHAGPIRAQAAAAPRRRRRRQDAQRGAREARIRLGTSEARSAGRLIYGGSLYTVYWLDGS